MKTIIKRDFIYIGIILLLIVGGYYLYTKKANTIQEQSTLIDALGDEVSTWKDKNNLNHVKIKALSTSNTKAFLEIESKDKRIIGLQNTVEKYEKNLRNGGSVSNFDIKVRYDTIYKSNSAGISNSDLCSSCNRIDSISNRFISTTFGFVGDSTVFSLSYTDEYSLIIGEEKGGWFSKPVPFGELTFKSPYSQTSYLRTYEVKDKRKKRLGLGGSIGATLSSDFTIKPYIGVGFNYTFIYLY